LPSASLALVVFVLMVKLGYLRRLVMDHYMKYTQW